MSATQYDSHLFSELYDVQPQAIVWLRPIWSTDKTTIVDFEFTYSNEEGLKYLNITREQQKGLRVSNTPTLSDEMRPKTMEDLLRVYHTGEAIAVDFYNAALDKYARVLRTKLRDGILNVIQDRTEENRIIKQQEAQTRYLHNILNTSLNTVITVAAVRNAKGIIKDFCYQQVNTRFLQWFSKNEEEVIGQTMLQLFPSTKDTGIFDVFCQVMETGNSVQTEVQFRHNGSEDWYDLMVARLNTNTVVSTFINITSRKKAYAQIEQQKALLDNLLKHSPAGISVSEAIRDEAGNIVDGRTIIANDAAVQYTDIPKEVYLTKTIRQIDPAMFESPLYQMALKTLQTGAPFNVHYFFEPGKKWLELSVAKMDADHLINVFIDVTNTKEAQLRQQHLVEELQRSNENLEEFAYAASHDLKEPIRKINFFTDRLKHRMMPRLDEEDTRILERMEKAAQRMGLLVDDLLLYSQVSRGIDTLERIDLNVKLRLVQEDLELLIQEKNAVIQVGNLPVVKGQRRQLQQLFQNLISNSLKYSKPDETPRISITARVVRGKETGISLPATEQEKQYHLIQIKDNGIGFEQENAERIFKVFTRLHGKGEYAGTGVGLSIAQKVVENHNGYIWAEGAPDQGATFSVLLPV